MIYSHSFINDLCKIIFLMNIAFSLHKMLSIKAEKIKIEHK